MSVERLSQRSIEFDITGVDASIANAFRRIMIAEVSASLGLIILSRTSSLHRPPSCLAPPARARSRGSDSRPVGNRAPVLVASERARDAHRACAAGFTELARDLETRAQRSAAVDGGGYQWRPDWDGDHEAVVAFRHEAWVIANAL